MKDKIKQYMAATYPAIPVDDVVLDIYLESVKDQIMNIGNLDTVPEPLEKVLFYRTIGNLVSFALFTSEGDVKALSEGDVSIQYDFGRQKAIVEDLLNYGQEQILCYRKIKW